MSWIGYRLCFIFQPTDKEDEADDLAKHHLDFEGYARSTKRELASKDGN